jgi:hypothetical protein
MYKSRIILAVFGLILALTVFSPESRAQAELVTNGSFETGDFTGWTELAITNAGDWSIYSGAPLNLLPPPDGEFASVTNQFDPDSNIIYQDIEVPPGALVACTVIVYLRNATDGTYIIGDGLTLNTSNQQMRVDIIDPAADPYTTGSGVLLNLFQTLPGDPNEIGYTPIEFDLTPFAGTTVRFRAAVVVTSNVLNGSIDGLSCVTTSIARNIPTLSEWGMIAAAVGLGLVGVLFVFRKRKAQAV